MVVVFGVLVVQWLTFGSNETKRTSHQSPVNNNVASSQMAFAASRTMPETINTHCKESRQASNGEIDFATMPETFR